MKAIGKVFLLISGIAFLVIGIWGMVTSALALAAAIAGLATNHDDGMVILIAAIIALAIAALLMLCYVFAGLRGIRSFTRGDSKNINRAFIWAVIILILNVASFFPSKDALAVSSIVGLVFDILYILGGFFVKLSK